MRNIERRGNIYPLRQVILWILAAVMILSSAVPAAAKTEKTKPVLSGFMAADRISRGSPVAVCGKVTSGSILKKVEVRICDSSGHVVQKAKALPGTKKYLLKKLSSQLSFESLKAGKYTLRVFAIDEKSGKSKLLVSSLVVEKSRKKAERLITAAEAEIGYETLLKEEKTKYEKEIFGSNGHQWCASFVSWCAVKAGISSKLVPRSMSTLSMGERAKKNYHPWDLNTWGNLKRGDVIFFSPRQSKLRHANGDKAVHHVGIVQDYDKKKGILYTVEGNVSRLEKDGTVDLTKRVVRRCTYRLKPKTGQITFSETMFFDGEYICGYIAMW